MKSMRESSRDTRDMLRELSIEAARLVDAGYYNVDPCRKRAPNSLRLSILNRSNNAIIAEIKRASPTAGWLRREIEVGSIVASIERGGAAGLSVITMPRYFYGDLEFLSQASSSSCLPILMKDFIVSKRQIDAGWRLGADAVLLIMKIFRNGYSEVSLEGAVRHAHALGMEVLLEVHGREELLEALDIDVEMIGVNSRDLVSMKTSVDNLLRTIDGVDVGEKVLIAESGIEHPRQILELRKKGFEAFLIGTAIMRSENVEEAVKSFVSAA
jgi:indole-3-glycerol phosphate synthase